MTPLSWFEILRLGLVQACMGALIVVSTSIVNRVMTVELAFPASLAGALIGIYYATQFFRPHFGHGTDGGRRRTPWVIGGVFLLGLGTVGSTLALALMATTPALGIAAAALAYLVVGIGIGAGGTNLLALLAAGVAPDRKEAAAALVWIIMIAGLAGTGITLSQVLEPFSMPLLIRIALSVSAITLAVTTLALWRVERGWSRTVAAKPAFRAVLRRIWDDPAARRFAVFVFVSMLAYNAQDLILEPYGGLVFGMSVRESTRLGASLHQGALMGMIAVFLSAGVLRRFVHIPDRVWIIGGCLASGVALIGVGYAGQMSTAWPLAANVTALGFFNGAFAVAAVGAMMKLASDGSAEEGARMGVFGAAQAIAFGLGLIGGTLAVDAVRLLGAKDATAYGSVFAAEGVLFFAAAVLALPLFGPARRARPTAVPGV